LQILLLWWRSVCRCRGGRGCWSGLGWRWPDRGAHDEEEIQEEDRDEDEASDEDVRTKSHISFVPREVGRWDVSVFVLVIMHAYQLRRKTALLLAL
jgi:hypothetical protein